MKRQKPNFRSKLEQQVWTKLKKTKGRRRTPQVEFETYKLPYVLEKAYIPDIILRRPKGKLTFVEVKGYLRSSDRTKMIAVKKMNPSLDIRFVFAKDNKLSKNSKTTYTMWADKHGFPWALQEIPKEWLTR